MRDQQRVALALIGLALGALVGAMVLFIAKRYETSIGLAAVWIAAGILGLLLWSTREVGK